MTDETLFISLNVPLLDNSVIIHAYKVFILPIAYPTLGKGFRFVLEPGYLAGSEDLMFCSIRKWDNDLACMEAKREQKWNNWIIS